MGRLATTSLDPELAAYAERCRDLLGLAEWDISLSEDDAPGGERGTVGHTILDTRYIRATVTLLRDRTPEQKRRTIRHEFLHIALAWVDQAARHIIMKLPEDDRAWAWSLYGEAEDGTIERLVRALDAEYT
jgi:hypothetical protein